MTELETKPKRNIVGRNIRHYRKQAGMTQPELARAIGWNLERGPSGGAISNYENGKPGFDNPRYDLLVRIAEALGISVSDLTSEDGEWLKAQEPEEGDPEPVVD
jgi:transcriptional regulator with XRE-family HTH domain